MATEKSIDISIAFDDTTYLIPQVYLQIASLRDKIPEGTTLHLTTTGNRGELVKYISKNIPTKIYTVPPIDGLKSRCSYLLHTMEIESDADYVLKTDLDILFLNDFSELIRMLKEEPDIIIQGENRRMISDDAVELRLWRNIYKALGVELPTYKFRYTENNEHGLPLFCTGAFVIKTDKIKEISEKWVDMTKVCERWIQYGIHPNESSLTAIVLGNKWKYILLPDYLHYNPIGHFRAKPYPCTDLIDNCILPENIFMLHWHRWQWLNQLMKVNKNVRDIVESCSQFIPNDVWETPFEMFHESI